MFVIWVTPKVLQKMHMSSVMVVVFLQNYVYSWMCWCVTKKNPKYFKPAFVVFTFFSRLCSKAQERGSPTFSTPGGQEIFFQLSRCRQKFSAFARTSINFPSLSLGFSCHAASLTKNFLRLRERIISLLHWSFVSVLERGPKEVFYDTPPEAKKFFFRDLGLAACRFWFCLRFLGCLSSSQSPHVWRSVRWVRGVLTCFTKVVSTQQSSQSPQSSRGFAEFGEFAESRLLAVRGMDRTLCSQSSRKSQSS